MNDSDSSRPGRWDVLVHRLRTLREEADQPSYAEIAQRVTALRIEAGERREAAGVARSSVYDSFRLGRVRLNLALVRDIALALGADEDEVREWIRSCRDSPTPVVDEVGADEARSGGSGPAEPEIAPAPHRPSVRTVVLVLVGCVLLNLVGRELVDLLHLPLFADMTGTAVAAIALGPWRGAAVGGTTNVVGIIGSGGASLPFALVNVAGALVWGYGVHRLGMGRGLPRFLALNLVVAFVCSCIAVTVLLVMFGGSVGHGQDVVAERVAELTGSGTAAVLVSNIVLSVPDKLVAGFVALVVVSTLLPWAGRGTLGASTTVLVGPARAVAVAGG